ncbi:MAG TPA: tyrosine-type recombinase/integrase, partial [Rugosimonospora sp.]|nr:tyrosine-type recombinase/integrase [Rugosimonospora sp.]
GRSALVFPSPEGLVWAKQNLNRRYWLPAVAAAQRCPIHPPQLPAKPRRGPRRRYRSDEVSTCDCAGRLHKTPRLHDLRHTHASWLIALHEDLFTVSRRLGHEDVSTTANIYGHLLKHGDGGRLRDMDERAA